MLGMMVMVTMMKMVRMMLTVAIYDIIHTRKNMLWGKPRSGKHTVMYSVHRSIVVKLVSEKLKTLSKTIKIRVKQLATASASEVSSHVGKFKTPHIVMTEAVFWFS